MRQLPEARLRAVGHDPGEAQAGGVRHARDACSASLRLAVTLDNTGRLKYIGTPAPRGVGVPSAYPKNLTDRILRWARALPSPTPKGYSDSH